jgi:hypothetical protein
MRLHDRNARLPIDLHTTGALRELHGLVLYCHNLPFLTHLNGKLPKPCVPSRNFLVVLIALHQND